MQLPERVAANFIAQAGHCERLGSPFTARLCLALPGALAGPVGDAVAAWPGDPAADALALRVAGALHLLARSGRCTALSAAYPPGTGDLGAGLARAFAGHADTLLPRLASAPQTNEVARSGAVLGLALTVAARSGLALDLLEIGASAGLNLGFDRYAYRLGAAGSWGGPSPVTLACDWQGSPPPPGPLRVAARAGSDLAPIDARATGERERMLSYIWADQTDRLARAEAALAMAAAAPWRIERAEAADWLDDRLARPRLPGTVRMLFHTIMWQYMPDASKARIRAALDRAGAAASAEAPLAWARMEADGRTDSAALLLTLWPGGATGALGRADWHGRSVAWGAP